MSYNPLKLSEEEFDQIEQLAGVGYGPEKIAMYLGVKKSDFMKEWKTPDSMVDHHYRRGVLITEAEAGMKLGENARAGNITAFQQLQNLKAAQEMEDLKKRILYGEETDGL